MLMQQNPQHLTSVTKFLPRLMSLGQSPGSRCCYRQLQALAEKVFQCTSAISALNVLLRCTLQSYILLTYLPTYLLVLKYWNTGHSLHVIVVVRVLLLQQPATSVGEYTWNTSYIGNRDRNFWQLVIVVDILLVLLLFLFFSILLFY